MVRAVLCVYQLQEIIVEDDTATAVNIVQEIVMKVMNRTSVHRLLLVCTNS